MRLIAVYLIGLLFGTGIMISGMASPAKVINFFDFAGSWDPSLIFVMGGALVTTFIGYRLVFTRERPWIAPHFDVPTATDIDARLIGGSALFGIGWGMTGFCPGGVLPAVGTARGDVALFVVSMLAGLVATRLVLARLPKRPPPATSHRLAR